MAEFMIRFFLCNVIISGIIGILLIVKRLLKHTLSNRLQYNLWFLLLIFLLLPFVPLRPVSVWKFPSWSIGSTIFSSAAAAGMGNVTPYPAGNSDWMEDFALSVTERAPSSLGCLLFGIWMTGILLMTLLVIRSSLRLRRLKASALPLQNPEVRRLYRHCLKEMHIQKYIPIYSTAFLKSPMITGLIKPRIYLPIHLISDYDESSIRYMLLHELQHYRYKDAAVNILTNLINVLYWFHPLVWYALNEMRSDREVACDSAVLDMIDQDSYTDYGHTLIGFAEKISRTPFPFTSGLGGSMKQIKQRILNIASYQKPTPVKKLKSITAFVLTAALLSGLAPFLSTYAADDSTARWNFSDKNISFTDLSAYFDGYEGSFVLYDLENNVWNIYNKDRAVLRVAPNSTYKIYDALFGLEEKVITPENSLIPWDGTSQPFEAWNADQTLSSAMGASVNWYFQSIDEQLGAAAISEYIQKIGYGNQNISGGLPAYWMESTLKISPVEQVELLTGLYANRFGFAPENVQAVKDAIRLSSSKTGTLYGKTGTGRIDEKDVNGWFIGFAETADNTYFFASNIHAQNYASGSTAAKITLSILSDLQIWN